MNPAGVTNLIAVFYFLVIFLGVFANFFVVVKIITSNTVFLYFDRFRTITRC